MEHEWVLIDTIFCFRFYKDSNDIYEQTYKIEQVKHEDITFGSYGQFISYAQTTLEYIIGDEITLAFGARHDRENNIQKEMADMFDSRSPFSTNYNSNNNFS